MTDRHKRCNVLHQRFSDPELAAIICHTGGGRGAVQKFIRELVLREVRYGTGPLTGRKV